MSDNWKDQIPSNAPEVFIVLWLIGGGVWTIVLLLRLFEICFLGANSDLFTEKTIALFIRNTVYIIQEDLYWIFEQTFLFCCFLRATFNHILESCITDPQLQNLTCMFLCLGASIFLFLLGANIMYTVDVYILKKYPPSTHRKLL